jgi:hypothetical protein
MYFKLYSKSHIPKGVVIIELDKQYCYLLVISHNE